MKTTSKFIIWFSAGGLLVALWIALSVWSFRQIEDTAAARKHAFVVLDEANHLLSTLKDAETGQRGYALTGDEAFLAPYLSARGVIVNDLNELRRHTSINAASKHLDAIAPLIDLKLANLSEAIELRRNHNMPAVIAAIKTGRGMQLMDRIRIEMNDFLQIEQDALAQQDAAFASKMRHMFIIIMVASLFALVSALAFAYLIYQRFQQRLQSLVLQETQHLLHAQEETNQQLQQANLKLGISEENLAVTLSSIGDGVIATDEKEDVIRMNPVAEQLTGWTQAEAIGQPINKVFHIVNKESRLLVTIPVTEALASGTVQGLANHTVLIARDETEYDIADSCAPIRDRDGQVVGAVLVFRDVTEEYQVQQILRDSSMMVRTILNTTVDSIITIHARGSIHEGIVETVNRSTERMFGYNTAEILGQKFSLLVPALDQEQQLGALEDYSVTDEESALGFGREVIGRHKDGSMFPMEMAVSEMWQGNERYFTGVLRDISVRKQAEAELLNSGALQRAIFNSKNFSSIATDAQGVIQIFNVGAERMLGYTAIEMMDKITPADISDSYEVIARAAALSLELDTPILPGFEALVFKASRGIEDIYELTYIRKDGSRFPALVSVTALRDDQDAIIGYLLIGTDNTARKQVEAERTLLDQVLKDKNTELEAARFVAETANLAKSEFLSNMSHELRTPLGAILGFAQLIDSGLPPPTLTQKRSIDQILQAGWYLLELINEILDLALVESGNLSISVEAVSLSEVLSECQSMVEPQAHKLGLTLVFNKPKIPYFVKADHTRMKQVLINLLSNAIKYNKNGGTVTVECSLSPPNSIFIFVKDTGIGLSQKQLAQLFQPFNRLGQEATAVEGTGIGLVMTKRLIELMEGEIGVESIVGKGSTFWIKVNLITEPKRTLSNTDYPLATSTSLPAKADGQLHTLLYVEDNPANLMLVEDIIARRSDIRLLSARDGSKGINLARSALPDMILMDINLPGISGITAMKMLSEDPTTAHIPVVALSANAIPHDIDKGLKAGFFRYLTKPIKVDELLETLDIALEFSKSQKNRNKNEVGTK